MTSCLLFHGPGARATALETAHRIGRLMVEPLGDEGLTVGEAREFVSLMMTPSSTGEIAVLVAGPMDHQTTQKSSDVLLKCIEEFDLCMQPILWAHDLGACIGTIRSRCLAKWCPSRGDEVPDDELDGVANQLVQAALKEQFWKLPGLMDQMKGREVELLRGVVEVLQGIDDERSLKLWDRLRLTAGWKNPTKLEVIGALLP